MSIAKKGYTKRLIDEKIDKYLQIFGAVCIEGPKWCGKTWTSLNHANSVIYIGSSENNFQNRSLAQLSPDLALDGESPRLVDEWQEVPSLWDAVRFKVDEDNLKGKYILTGSATPKKKGIMHSGTGRIAKVRMRPMSLYESGESNGKISLKDLFLGNIVPTKSMDINLEKLIELTIRGGWPASIKIEKFYEEIPKAYIKSLLEEDVYKLDDIKYDASKMAKLLKSLARNISTTVTNKTLQQDIIDKTNETMDVDTITNYIDIFKRLFIIEEIPAYSTNLRSSTRVGKKSKKIFVDPSLAIATLGLTKEMLIKDLNTFGFLFECLCLRDLQIYAESIGASLYHYRDDKGLEVDAIVELEDSKYGAFEIKLGANQVDEAAKNLLNFNQLIDGKKPEILVVICGIGNLAYKREDGVYVIPITTLKN